MTTTHRKALASAAPDEAATLGGGNVRVYLITMKGHFVPLPVASPILPGKRPPPGNYLSIVVDAKTFQVIDLGLSAKPPRVDPASLGPVTYLTHLARPIPTPSPSPAVTRAPACAAAQLKITLVDSGVATGHVGGVIGFINQGKAPCTLTGWPSLIPVTASGRTAVASHVLQTFFGPPSMTSPPVVTLRPGHRAEAALEGIDLPLQAKRCPPSYHSLRVTPPGGTHASVISAWLPGYGRYLPACAPLSVSPVVRPSLLPY